MLHHPKNDHWREWREAVRRTGYTDALQIAAQRLLLLDQLTLAQVHDFLSSIEKHEDNIACHYRDMARKLAA
jgi:hypothetical protein